MDTRDFSSKGRHFSLAGDLDQAFSTEGNKIESYKIGALADCEERLERAEIRTEQAEARTQHAKTRIEQAESRTEEAEARTEKAKTRTEQAEIRSEEAETRSERSIRDSELSYRRLFEATKDGILILEADTGRINDVNPFLTLMLGFSRDELIGTPIWELGAFKDLVSNKAKFEQLQEQGYARDESLPLETKDHQKIAVEFVSTVYRAGDRNVIQCNVRDITERRRAAEQMRNLNLELEKRVRDRTAELQGANEELEAFSYSVSHDLRSPLRHIGGFLQQLPRNVGDTISEKNLVHINHICEATKRMGNLIDDLLSFSRLGKSDMRKAEINLAELIQATVRDLEPETKGRNIAWEIHSLPVVRADLCLLRQVFLNLISNAIKFTSARAEAKIEIGCLSSLNDESVIFVRDNGAGFNQEYAGRLFGVFQRLHSDEEFEGTGIGLANVQRIIHRHGGRTWAEGVVNVGATFFVLIPN